MRDKARHRDSSKVPNPAHPGQVNREDTRARPAPAHLRARVWMTGAGLPVFYAAPAAGAVLARPTDLAKGVTT